MNNQNKANKRTLKGTVVSDKMDKTIVVLVERIKEHRQYRRRYRVSKKYKVHDPEKKFKIGDRVVASVKLAEPRKIVKKKEIVRAVIIRQKKTYRRDDGTYIRFDDNAAVIVIGKEPRGNRIFGPVPRELKEAGFDRIISLATEVL